MTNPVSKSELVYKYLKEKILANELKPGEYINLQKVGEELGISKIPIREGIKRLESIGLVETTPNVGVRVKKLDLNELEQLMLIRRELETLATRMAAEKIDRKTIKKLYTLIDKMEAERQAGNVNQYGIINKEFHLTIYRSSQAELIYNMIEDLWDRSERTRWVFSMFPERLKLSNREHVELVKLLEEHDGRAADIIYKQKTEGFLNVIRVLKELEIDR
ncbi:MAG: GntR family transcriptional regulator [Peptococcaceae bacterium]|nr:GntR family transcriptional regulator [Peptococcaceae bacterium]MDH7524641.1 GntR family transcriptional regulator [Peptococcaceae bacterium]